MVRLGGLIVGWSWKAGDNVESFIVVLLEICFEVPKNPGVILRYPEDGIGSLKYHSREGFGFLGSDGFVFFFFFKMGFIAMNFTHHLGEEINENIFLNFFGSRMKEASTQMILCGSEVSVK